MKERYDFKKKWARKNEARQKSVLETGSLYIQFH